MWFMNGKQLWQTARDLHEQAEALPDAKIPIRHTTRTWGYAFAAVILRPLAAEYLLKGLSVRDYGRIKKTHNLLKLFNALDQNIQAEIAEHGAHHGIDVPEFLNEHRNVFSEWRYWIEGVSSMPGATGLDSLLATLVAVCQADPDSRP